MYVAEQKLSSDRFILTVPHLCPIFAKCLASHAGGQHIWHEELTASLILCQPNLILRVHESVPPRVFDILMQIHEVAEYPDTKNTHINGAAQICS
eukprot:SAG31_NODE_610_length_13564_cov_3.189528_7_plen_95_part_00